MTPLTDIQETLLIWLALTITLFIAALWLQEKYFNWRERRNSSPSLRGATRRGNPTNSNGELA